MDVLALVAVGFSVCVVMSPVLNTIADRVGDVVDAVRHWAIAYLVVLVLAGAAWFGLIRLGGFRLSDMWPSNLVRYPPVWLGALAAAVAYLVEVPLEGSALHQDGASLTGTLALGAALAVGLDKLWRRHRSRRIVPSKLPERGEGRTGLCVLLDDPKRLVKWLQKEKPIEEPTEDLWGVSVMARRIQRLFRESPLKTIGVVGPYGSGKTSLLRLVNHYLQEAGEQREPSEMPFPPDRIIICDIASWGFREGSAAEHVLKAAVKELSNHVDCLGLAGLPSAYRAALADTGSPWGRLLAAGTIRCQDPIAILRKMDGVLACIAKRLVVYLEDIDRNPADQRLRSEISGLLDRVKDLTHLSFVLSIAREAHGRVADDIARICEHTETLPELPPRDVLRLVAVFRGHCFKTSTLAGDMDPVSDKDRERRLGLERCLTVVDCFSPVLVRGEPALAIQRLLASPRAAKSALRRTWQAWQGLHGEIEFDDLMVASVLRVGAPEAFWFLLRHAEQLRLASAGDKGREAVTDRLRKEWSDITRNVLWDREAADTLVGFLFPGWKESNGLVAGPQGVRHAEPVDYWVRLNAEEVPKEELCDQAVLRALPKWREEPAALVYDSMDLPSCILLIEGFDAKVQHFGLRFFGDGEEVRDLAHQLFQLIREGKGTRKYWRRFEDLPEYPGFHDLTRLALKRSIQEGHDAWILEEIRLTLPLNLRLATELYAFWRFANEQEQGRKEPKPELQRYMRAEAQKLFANDPEALIRALEPDRNYIYAVSDLAAELDKRPRDEEPFGPEEWAWLACALLPVAQMDPQVALPQIVGLLRRVPDEPLGPLFADMYDQRANKLFGSKIETAKEFLAREIDTSKFTEKEKRQIKYARDWARSPLSESQGLDQSELPL
jgi:hypothetical protein